MNKIEYYNKKARFDYAIEESFEAGLVLQGPEIKAIRSGRVNLTGSYVKILSGELFWVGASILAKDSDPTRSRKLLVKKQDIGKYIGKTAEKGFSLIPLKLYITRGRAKLEVGLGKGKKKHDKRNSIKEKDLERDFSRKTVVIK